MPLIFKARKPKPKWVDFVPTESPELGQSYDIAAKNQAKFSRAFLQMQRSLIDEKTEKAIRTAWNKGAGLQEILNIIPLFNEGETDQEKVWRRLALQLDGAYKDVIEQSGQASMRGLNRAFGTDIKFNIDDTASVLKQKDAPVPIVPVNPYSIKWMREASLRLVKQGITKAQIDVLRRILTSGFERGIRGEALLKEIKKYIGLTDREYSAVLKRQALHEQAGLAAAEVEKLTDKYRNRLLTKRAARIARTETIATQAHGRNVAWLLAQESGALPPVERVWVSAPESPNPTRPCEICLDLDGKTAAIGEAYSSAFLGAVAMPPSHPHCRCTEIIRRREE